MELYLQVGWGMMGHCRALIKEWGGGTVILSPRDLDEPQLIRLSQDLRKVGGRALLDPQFYLPRADHPRLTSHGYWPKEYETAGFAGEGRPVMMQELAQLNRRVGSTHFIVPGERAENVSDTWLESQRGLLEAAKEVTERPLIATICLSAEAIRRNDQISRVMADAELMHVSGFYLVLERPGLAYLVDDPQWLANTLDLAAGLRRLGADVVVGYSNHQQLVMASAGVNAIASGSWMNVRTFPPPRFTRPHRDKKRARPPIWYYCPQALSEYALPYLDIAVRRGLTPQLRTDPWTSYAAPLFGAGQPSASGWRESEAFRHYLAALRIQVQRSTKSSFDETVSSHQALLDRAESLLGVFRKNGVFSRDRGFWDSLDANRSALTMLSATQGPILRHRWGDLV